MDFYKQFALKNVLYFAWVALISTSLVPLINMVSAPIIYQALLATGVTVGSFGLVAYNAPSEKFLRLGGPLALGLGGLLGTSMLSVINPGSLALYNTRLYGGLAVFSAFVLYDTQMILQKAKTQSSFDPINEAIKIYLDAVNIFIKFVEVFARSQSKKDRRD